MKAVNISNLDQIAGGALAEKFNDEMAKVLENIYDPNTEAEKARTITISIKVQPDQDRDSAVLTINCVSKIVAPKAVATRVYIDKDDEGNVVASEITKTMPGQISLEGEVTNPKITQLGRVASR